MALELYISCTKQKGGKLNGEIFRLPFRVRAKDNDDPRLEDLVRSFSTLADARSYIGSFGNDHYSIVPVSPCEEGDRYFIEFQELRALASSGKVDWSKTDQIGRILRPIYRRADRNEIIDYVGKLVERVGLDTAEIWSLVAEDRLKDANVPHERRREIRSAIAVGINVYLPKADNRLRYALPKHTVRKQ